MLTAELSPSSVHLTKLGSTCRHFSADKDCLIIRLHVRSFEPGILQGTCISNKVKELAICIFNICQNIAAAFLPLTPSQNGCCLCRVRSENMKKHDILFFWIALQIQISKVKSKGQTITRCEMTYDSSKFCY